MKEDISGKEEGTMNVDVAGLQVKILEMAVYLDGLCRKHNIVYFLACGSALGAVRHQGFIPWDDDFDVFMTHDNYARFIDVCRLDLDAKRFYLQREATAEWPLFYSKLRMNGTSYVEEYNGDRPMHKGVFIDIFCLNNVPDSRVMYCMQYLFSKALIAGSLRERGYGAAGAWKKIAMFIAGLFVRGAVKKALLGFIRGFNDQETRLLANFFGRVTYKNAVFPRDYMGAPRYVKFSGAMLPVPQQAEKYLTLRYGDYMKMPDEGTQKKLRHAVSVELDKGSE